MPLERLDELINELRSFRSEEERQEYLVELAERFEQVPRHIAERPFPESSRVPGCESQVFVWVAPRPSGGIEPHFAIDNPHGISAKATAVLLKEALVEAGPHELEELSVDLVYRVFGNGISMGKGQGLINMVAMTKVLARATAKRLNGSF